MSDSHTAFNQTTFNSAMLGGTSLFAAAMVSTLQAAAARNANGWENWSRSQLERALELSEALRQREHARVVVLERELMQLKQVFRKRGAAGARK
ncbi:hypothetical protein JQ596_08575 [Bradyrhizobium manausense]|uniref:hypothetical protein n=1 Tax=Bradyrhizobium manausense TaxID=989370 RepID=UPI001BA5F4BE|nr:hypothetical protein [Bradyrhizobium manausense]MBR0825590.1 hypothetical protein [Bradyrhizobium manausense]